MAPRLVANALKRCTQCSCQIANHWLDLLRLTPLTPDEFVNRFLARTGRPTTFADISQQFLIPTFYRRKRFADATICETEISGVFDSVANHADSPALGAATDVGDFRDD